MATVDASAVPNSVDRQMPIPNYCQNCCRESDLFCLGPCDHPICLECGVRMRAVCESNECPICRSEIKSMLVVKDPRLKFAMLKFCKTIVNKKYGLKFPNEEALNAVKDILAHVCTVCEKKSEFSNFDELSQHMRRVHELFYCDLCASNLQLFSWERKWYSRVQLAKHRRIGDPDDPSHRGHPLCEFCDERVMDIDQLYRHWRRDHFFCHFCDADWDYKAFASVEELEDHLKSDHYYCEEGQCKKEPFGVAFRHEIDLRAHKASVHGSKQEFISTTSDESFSSVSEQFMAADQVHRGNITKGNEQMKRETTTPVWVGQQKNSTKAAPKSTAWDTRDDAFPALVTPAGGQRSEQKPGSSAMSKSRSQLLMVGNKEKQTKKDAAKAKNAQSPSSMATDGLEASTSGLPINSIMNQRPSTSKEVEDPVIGTAIVPPTPLFEDRVEYDFFLSHRRDTGAGVAWNLKEKLEAAGYSVFLDVIGMRPGKFKDQLIDLVRSCKIFVLILTKDSMNNCVNPNDFLALEIETALTLKSSNQIFLLHEESFSWAAAGQLQLPQAIRQILDYQSYHVCTYYRGKSMDTIIGQINEMYLRNNRSFLVAHLTSLKNYLLLSQGDFARHLMEILERELNRSANEERFHNFSRGLEMALRLTNAQCELKVLLERLQVDTSAATPGSTTGWDLFSLKYKTDGPLAMVVNNNCLNDYSRLFRFIWRLKRITFSLSSLWHRIMSSTKLLESYAPDIANSVLRPYQLSASEMSHFIECMQNYIMFEVIERGWRTFQRLLAQTQPNLNAVINLHVAYLQTLLCKSFLANYDSQLLNNFYAALDTILEFHRLCNDFLDKAVTVAQTERKLKSKSMGKQKMGKQETFGNVERAELEKRRNTREQLESSAFRPKLKELVEQFRLSLQQFVVLLNDQWDPIGQMKALCRQLNFNGFYQEEDAESDDEDEAESDDEDEAVSDP